MGRRAVAKYVPPQGAARLVQNHFIRLEQGGGINLTQYRAQQYEEKMIDTLAGLALDVSGDTPVTARIRCAELVVMFARGRVRDWMHDGETIDPGQMTTEGIPVGEMIEKQRKEVELATRLNELWTRRVPPDKWPPDIREAVGKEALAFYTPEAES